ncbi:MAG: hypothetical protein LJE83_11160 [Gammaproteobacteria bacterium]|jgi:hypothetical protein|nr:hypothetical protein [Gammaproteobacteria bacterium]
MNNEIINKAGEILYISGYADTCELFDTHVAIEHNGKQLNVDPFKNTLEGKRQACVIIEWLKLYKNKLWEKSTIEPDRPGQTSWQYMLKRLEWCLYAMSR